MIAKTDIDLTKAEKGGVAALKYYMSNGFEGEPERMTEPPNLEMAELKALTSDARKWLGEESARVLKELAAT